MRDARPYEEQAMRPAMAHVLELRAARTIEPTLAVDSQTRPVAFHDRWILFRKFASDNASCYAGYGLQFPTNFCPCGRQQRGYVRPCLNGSTLGS